MTIEERLEYLFDELGKSEKGAKPGFINQRFMPMIREARNATSKGISEGIELFQDKLSEIYCISNADDLRIIIAENTVPKDVGIKIKQGEQEVPLVLSQNQAYKKWQEWESLKLIDVMKKMGYTQETMNAIKDFINPEVMEWAEWQSYDFYPRCYAAVNHVFREIMNVDLPFNVFFTPMLEDELTISCPNLFKRYSPVKNDHQLKLLDGDKMLIRHLIEMEHFKAWAEPLRELRFFFGDKEIRTAIKENRGPHLLQAIDDALSELSTCCYDIPTISIFSRIFLSNNNKAALEIQDELKEARAVLEEANSILNNQAGELVRTIINRVINDEPQKIVKIIKDGTPPNHWIYIAIANLTGDLLESGDYHIYRGVLNPLGIGADLLSVFDAALDKLVLVGAINSDNASEQKRALRENIEDAG